MHERHPTLLVQPAPTTSLEPGHVSRLLQFGASFAVGQAILRQRAGVVVIEEGRVAVIERRRSPSSPTYYVLPGGGMDLGESIEQAAQREALEEASLVVRTRGPVAHVRHRGDGRNSVQHYLAAGIIEGDLGPGAGPEYAADAPESLGVHRPMWLPLDRVAEVDVRPAALLTAVAAVGVDRLLRSPLLVDDV